MYYDEVDMAWDLKRSLEEGVLKSKVVLACISQRYEKSMNSILELTEVSKLVDKPIVALSTDANPFAWAGQNQSRGDLKQLCGISGQGKLFFDIGDICARPGWDESDESKIPTKNIEDLHEELEKLVMTLQGSHINCMPSMRPKESGTLSKLLSSPVYKGFNNMERIHLVLQLSRRLVESHNTRAVHGSIDSSHIYVSEHYPPQVALLPNSDNGSIKSKDASLSLSTDVYDFGLVCYQVLCRKPIDRPVEGTIIKTLSSSCYHIPVPLRRLIEDCLSSIEDRRPTALECHTLIEKCYNAVNSITCDIYFDHPWGKRPVCQHIYRYLEDMGYKVWYDEFDVQWDLERSMKEAIANSKVFLPCISRLFEQRPACMFSMKEASKLGAKPIVVLSSDVNPLAWAGQDTTHGDLKQLCGLSDKDKLIFDIGEICARPGWYESDESKIPKKDMIDLHMELNKLVSFLRGSQINCTPSFMGYCSYNLYYLIINLNLFNSTIFV